MRFSLESVSSLADAETRLTALVSASRSDPMARVNILVGSNLQRLSLRRHLAAALGPTANLRFFTPVDLAAAARDRGPGVARQPLPDGADTLLVEGILLDLQGERALRRLRPGTAGVAEAVASSLTDLREAHLSSDDFAAVVRPGDDPKLHDLEAIFRRFEALIARFRDRSSLYEDALDPILPDDAFRAALGDGPLLVAGIYDVPVVQLSLLRRAAAVADVRVFLVRNPADPALGFAEEFAAALRAAGASEAGPPADATPAPEPARSYFSAPSRQAEAEEITRRVLTLAHEHGVPFNEIAILHRLDHSADDTVAAALGRAGIPVYRSAGRPLRHTAIGRAALVLLDLLIQTPARHRLLEFFASPVAAPRIPPGVVAKPVLWERHSKQAGMVSDWQRFQDQLPRYIDGLHRSRAGDFALETAEELRDVVTALAQRHATLAGCRSWRDFCDWFLALLDDYVAPADVQLDQEGRDPLALARAQIEALAQLDGAGLPASADRFRAAAARALRRAVLNDPDPLRRGVFVGNVSAARSVRFRAVFLAECAERIFPPLVRQDPLLLDGERQELNRRLGAGPERGRGPRLAVKRERAREEPMLFRLVEQSAVEFLTISWARRTNTTGAPKLPSPLLLASIPGDDVGELAAVEELYASGKIDKLPARLAGAAPSLADARAGDWSRTVSALDRSDFTLAILEAAGKGAARALLGRLWPDYERYDAARRSRNSVRFGAWDGIVPGDELTPATLQRPASPTALEDYATCPYRYYLKQVLHVGAVPEPAEALQMTPLDRGSMVHEILERWVKEAQESEAVWAEFLDDGERLLAIAEEVFEAQQQGGLAGLPATWTVVRQEVLTDLQALMREERARAAQGYEPLFAPEWGFKNLTLTLPNQRTLTFQGRIDRVDRGPEGAVAVDYKTGAASKRGDDYRSGAALQLPIYLQAVANETGEPAQNVRAEYWYATRKGKFARSGVNGRDVLNDAQYWEALSVITEGIRAGRFFPHPGSGNPPRPNCRFCDYRSVCATDVDRRFTHKARQDLAVVSDFLKLQARR